MVLSDCRAWLSSQRRRRAPTKLEILRDDGASRGLGALAGNFLKTTGFMLVELL